MFSGKVTRAKLNFIFLNFLHLKVQLKAEEEARQRKAAEEREAQQEKRREERRQQKLVSKHLICFPPSLFPKDSEEKPLSTSTQSAARVT